MYYYEQDVMKNSEFSFSDTGCLTKPEELSLPYYLLRAGKRTYEFMRFPGALVPS